MKHRLLFVLIAFAVAACGSSDGGIVAGDEGPLGAGPYPVATLDITVSHPAVQPLSYTISCQGDTATVVADLAVDVVATEACLDLNDDKIVTRLVEGAPSDQVCTEIYGGPDLAAIVGTIDGVAVDTTIDRANGCGIADWDMLGRILPTALGVVLE